MCVCGRAVYVRQQGAKCLRQSPTPLVAHPPSLLQKPAHIDEVKTTETNSACVLLSFRWPHGMGTRAACHAMTHGISQLLQAHATILHTHCHMS
jgi:hypothetical protein